MAKANLVQDSTLNMGNIAYVKGEEIAEQPIDDPIERNLFNYMIIICLFKKLYNYEC